MALLTIIRSGIAARQIMWMQMRERKQTNLLVPYSAVINKYERTARAWAEVKKPGRFTGLTTITTSLNEAFNAFEWDRGIL